MQIRDDGIIYFSSSYISRTRLPQPLPINGIGFIAPYWADVDTVSGAGQIFYRESTDPSVLARASREIRTALSLAQNIKINNVLIATWDSVGYFVNGYDKVCN